MTEVNLVTYLSEPEENLMTAAIRSGIWTAIIFALVPGLPAPKPYLIASEVTLKNGFQLSGRLGKVGSLMQNPLQNQAREGTNPRLIVLVHDDLRRVFVSTYQIAEGGLRESEPSGTERFKIPQRVAKSGKRVGGVGTIIHVSPWDKYGRRVFSMNVKGRGRVDIIQGITDITPRWTKAEGLQGDQPISWDMRFATSSIPRDQLTAILEQHLDPKRAENRLRVVSFYTQAERYSEARQELTAAIREFPHLENLKNEEKALRQLGANQLIREIQQRRQSGQHQMAFNLLSSFPDKMVAQETLLKVKQLQQEYETAKGRYAQVLELIARHSQTMEDGGLVDQVQAIQAEISARLNVNNLHRFNDYLRFADDDALAAEQKLSLGLSSWLLGNGSGIQNLTITFSLYQVRDLVREYLQTDLVTRRTEILEELESLEGGVPSLVSKLVQQMDPPLKTEMASQTEIPGMYKLSVAGLTGQADVNYFVQLPPEYDPCRSYPALVTLHSAGTTPELQIDWWAGNYSPEKKQRLGQATRHGYIVIAPQWTKAYQAKYEYSAREHAAVLFALRNACKRFSIDTDRVYLSGHSIGGDAAWDMGLAHPDLWAGVLPIAATADKYVSRYWRNAHHVPFYFVMGELDGNKLALNSRDMDRYLTHTGFDTMVVEYLGRGHEHFQDEIHHLFRWAELHERNFSPTEFNYESMRSWDNFCWWMELDNFPPRSMVPPFAWPGKGGSRPVVTNGKTLTNNQLRIKTGAGRCTVWLSPDNIDFSRKLTIVVNGRKHLNPEDAVPRLEILLEDVRTRGDRQHPFWAKVELPTGRLRK